MKRYLKLVNFEFNRFAKLFAILLGIVLAVQMTGVIVICRSYLQEADEAIYKEQMSQAEFLDMFGMLSFEQIVGSVWFLGPIALAIAAVAFYIFFIWYRDWFAKNTFIYRLLMLPTTRLNLFFAKLSTILLVTFGFVGFQLMILPLETRLMQWMVPKDFRADMALHDIMNLLMKLHILFPQTFTEFILHYGMGTVVVSVIFTAVLFERSFRWKGILLGVIYGIIAIGVLISPVILQYEVFYEFFYPGEMLLLELAAGLVVLAGSIWISNFLLKKKIRV